MEKTCENCGRTRAGLTETWCEEFQQKADPLKQCCFMWSGKPCWACAHQYVSEECDYCDESHSSWKQVVNADVVRAIPQLRNKDLSTVLLGLFDAVEEGRLKAWLEGPVNFEDFKH